MKEGQVVRIDIDSDGDDEFGPGKIYQMRSCVRGRTNRQRIYSPDRIQKPLKRVEGTKRGEGKYEEITWDEAIDLIATTMKEIKEEYGNDAFYIQYGTGVLGGLCAYPVATLFMSVDAATTAVTAYIIPFFISTFVGSLIAGALVFALQAGGALKRMQRTLAPNVNNA